MNNATGLSNYESLDDETKRYLNTAMDIYAAVKDKEIQKTVKHLGKELHHIFTKLDKKILSLYLSAFLTDGNLKDILEEYDDLKVQSILDFMNLTKEEIKTLNPDDYSDFYQKNLLIDLLSIENSKISFSTIEKYSPEVIFDFFNRTSINNSDILNYFGNTLPNHQSWFYKHPSFNAVEQSAKLKGYLKDKEVPKKSDSRYPDIFDVTPTIFHQLTPSQRDLLNKIFGVEIETQPEKVSNQVEKDKWEILDDIMKKFIGQETAVEELFYNIINNQQLADREDVQDGERSIIFLDGPTGTGKLRSLEKLQKDLAFRLSHHPQLIIHQQVM